MLRHNYADPIESNARLRKAVEEKGRRATNPTPEERTAAAERQRRSLDYLRGLHEGQVAAVNHPDYWTIRYTG